ncbi:hypothetical protein PIB30_075079, partial [Stylosanthes scabra]|nr:hypothetical protein [Stylosanthes scabra]
AGRVDTGAVEHSRVAHVTRAVRFDRFLPVLSGCHRLHAEAVLILDRITKPRI